MVVADELLMTMHDGSVIGVNPYGKVGKLYALDQSAIYFARISALLLPQGSALHI
jgi:hypothetical protein